MSFSVYKDIISKREILNSKFKIEETFNGTCFRVQSEVQINHDENKNNLDPHYKLIY